MIEKLDSAMAPDDGLRWFNLLYMKVTQQARRYASAKWLAGPGMACAAGGDFRQFRAHGRSLT